MLDTLLNRLAAFLDMETPWDFAGVLLCVFILWYFLDLLADFGQPHNPHQE